MGGLRLEILRGWQGASTQKPPQSQISTWVKTQSGESEYALNPPIVSLEVASSLLTTHTATDDVLVIAIPRR